MDRDAVLAAFDDQIRRHPESATGSVVEHGVATTRVIASPDGWSGVTWSDLGDTDVDAAIRAEVAAFAAADRRWEWKLYSYDRPPSLTERLRAHGLVPDEVETLMIAPISDMDLHAAPPREVEVVQVRDEAGVDALVTVHDQAFGGDHSAMGRSILATISDRPTGEEAFVAYAGATPIAAGRVSFHVGTDFASLWGGGTIQAWRGRGVFRSLVSHRAARAAARGFRYLQVDASADSRPILLRLGFVQVAQTIPYTMSTHLGG
ncbi:MAG: GNAT family N-acetyltransferase [Actinomycetota bacterium]|nr:GNAT family N-acetyltransferase [Actinomycetota bacterium]